MSAMASQITSPTIVYSTIYSGADKKTSKLRVTGLCEGNSPVTGEFHAQKASNAENASICHGDVNMRVYILWDILDVLDVIRNYNDVCYLFFYDRYAFILMWCFETSFNLEKAVRCIS